MCSYFGLHANTRRVYGSHMTIEDDTSPDLVFARQFRAERERTGMTQDEVAREMVKRGHDFHQQTVYKLENSRRKVSIGEAVDLADTLGVPVDALAISSAPPGPGALVRRAGADLVDQLAVVEAHVLKAGRLQGAFLEALQNYLPETADFAFESGDLSPDEKPIVNAFMQFARFEALARYTHAWRDLMADPDTHRALRAFGFERTESSSTSKEE